MGFQWWGVTLDQLLITLKRENKIFLHKIRIWIIRTVNLTLDQVQECTEQIISIKIAKIISISTTDIEGLLILSIYICLTT